MENNHERDLIINEELADLRNVANILSLNINRCLRLLKVSIKLKDHTDDKVTFAKYLLDVVRASVVFLHTALETMLREIVRLKLIYDGDISNIPLVDVSGLPNRKEKFSLNEFAKYRGYTVDKVIEMSVNKYVANLSFNSTNDIADNFSKINLPQSKLTPYYEELNKMMNRRHQIVHEGDLVRGTKTSELEHVSGDQIKVWIKCTANFSEEVMRLAIEKLCLDKIVGRLENKGIPFDKDEILRSIKVVTPDNFK